jgi:hypothetical protein
VIELNVPIDVIVDTLYTSKRPLRRLRAQLLEVPRHHVVDHDVLSVRLSGPPDPHVGAVYTATLSWLINREFQTPGIHVFGGNDPIGRPFDHYSWFPSVIQVRQNDTLTVDYSLTAILFV